MGTLCRVLGAWLLMLVVQQCCFPEMMTGVVKASHVVHRQLDSVPPAIVDPKLRTAYHFQPPKNWINDPNGPMYYKGFYHLFYQYNPKGAVWGNIVWAHSVSKDLINWMALDIAIYPSIPSDEYGCWSGSATIQEDGTPVIIYTGINNPNINYQVQNIAYPKNASDPYLREWVKPDYNPIISPVDGINATEFRDPTTAWYNSQDGYWRILVGSLRGKKRGLAYIYRTQDFKKWERAKHPIHSALTGMWECPDFFPVPVNGENGLDVSAYGEGIKHVLKASLDLTRYDYYTVGTYYRSEERYEPDNPSGDYNRLRYDYGDYYASKTFYDPVKRRRILLGWANESDTTADDVAKGWAGIHAIPRKIWLDPNGKQLVQWPIEELEALRGKQNSLSDKVVKSGEYFEVTGVTAAQADVEVIFDISSLENAEPFDQAFSNDAQALCGMKGADVKGGVGPFGLWVLASANLEERTAVFFRIFKDAYGKHVVLMCNDPTRSSLIPDLYKPTFAGFLDVDIVKDGKIFLRTLIDHSVVESFGAGGKTCILSRIYPSLAIGDSAHLFVFNNGAEDVKVCQLNAWDMKKAMIN